MTLILAICWAVVVAWLIARAARQGRALMRLPSSAAPRADLPAATVVVPARNESLNIVDCLSAILAQDYPADRLRAVMVDDNSTDDTVALARAMAARDPRLSVISAGPLPAGWVGKAHGCVAGASAAGERPEWLCFVDADVRLAPAALSAAVAHAAQHGIDMLCLTPRQELVGPLERLVIPCGFYALAFTRHFEAEAEGQGGAVAATGQFMLVRRSGYEAVGGHASVAGIIAEDLALAQRFLAHGLTVRLRGGEHLASVRMYRDGISLWDGFAKNAVEMFGGPVNTALIALAGLALAWLSLAVPACVLGFGRGPPLVEGAAITIAALASAAVFAFHIAGALFLRIPLWYGLIFPVGYTCAAILALDSTRRRRFGGATRWKGRIYP